MLNKQLDILLIEPNTRHNYQKLSEEGYSALEPGTWSLLLAGGIRAKGFGVEILDCNLENYTPEESAKKIKERNARLNVWVVYGQNPNSGTTNISSAYKASIYLKQLSPEIKIGFVGSHTSALPKEVLVQPFVDYVFVGDGLYSILNLLKTNFTDKQENVKGIGWKPFPGTYKFNEPEIVVPQYRLDIDLPEMALDLIDLKRYKAHSWHRGFKEESGNFLSAYTSLGCIRKCSFCMINSVNREGFNDVYSAKDTSYMRFWSPQHVLKQFEKFSELGIKYLRYADELFALNPRHYKPILEGIIERKLPFSSWVYARIDGNFRKDLPLFKKAGVDWYAVGIEHANQEIRFEDIEKGKFTNLNIRDVIKDIQNNDISIVANYIFGFEHDNYKTMQETLDLALELNTEMANMYAAAALPASSLYWSAKEKGWELPSTFEGYSFLGYETLPLPTKYLTGPQVLEFRDKAWKTYFTSQRYLKLIEDKFGVSAKEYIQKMASINLKRKVLGD